MFKKQCLFFFSFLAIIFSFSSSFSATVVEPSNNSLFILLNTVYDSKTTLEENKCITVLPMTERGQECSSR